jgi:hypothetical protein
MAASILGGQSQQDVQSAQPNASMMMGSVQMELVYSLRGLMDNEDAMVQELKQVTRELRILNSRTGTMGQVRNAVIGREVWSTQHGTAQGVPAGGLPGTFVAAGHEVERGLASDFEQAIREAMASVLAEIRGKRAPGAPSGKGKVTEPAKVPPVPPGTPTGGEPTEPPGTPRNAPGAPDVPPVHPSHQPHPHFAHADLLESLRSSAGVKQHLIGRLASSARVQKWKPTSAMGRAVKGGMQYAASEEGGSMLGAAAEGLGELGLTAPLAVITGGITAGAMAVHQIQEQRAANAKWQEIMGGSNIAGAGQRARSRMFQFSQMGVMGGREAQELFFGVSQIGLGQSQRQGALDLATQAYKNLGMTIADSIELINTEAQHGQEGLAGVASALQSVTNAAKAAGQNAKEARALFTTGVTTTSNVVGGAAAVPIAQALTTSLTSSGLQRMFGQTGLTGLVNEQNIALGASQQGMTYAHALNMLNDPNASNAQKLQLIQGPAWTWLSQRIPANVQKYIKDNTHPGMSPGEIAALGREVLDRAGIDPRIGAQMAQQFGTPTQTPDQLGSFIVAAAGGLIDPERDAAALEAKGKPFQPVAGSKVARELKAMKGTVTAAADVTPKVSYLQAVSRTGYESPIAQGLLDTGVTNRKFKVKSAEGDKIVDFKTAMSTYYDQIASGEAIDMTTGQNVASSVGMSPVAAQNMPSGLQDSASLKNVGKGETLAHYTARTQKAADKAAGQAHVTVTLDATDWLKQRFRFLDTSTAPTDPNAALLPPPIQVTSSALNSGNP